VAPGYEARRRYWLPAQAPPGKCRLVPGAGPCSSPVPPRGTIVCAVRLGPDNATYRFTVAWTGGEVAASTPDGLFSHIAAVLSRKAPSFLPVMR